MTTKTDEARKCAGQWVHCSPYLIYAGVDCAKTPRRPCECDFDESHDHFISWAKHFPPSVPVQSVYAAIDAEEELSDEPPKEMQDWLEHATPDEIIEAMRIAVRQTKDGIRNRVKALIAEAK